SANDGWARKRLDFGLRAILPPQVRIPGISFQQHIAGAGVPIEAGKKISTNSNEFQYHTAGQGRVVHAPALVDPSTQANLFNPDHTFNVGLDLTNWRIPDEADALRKALAWLMRDRQTVAVTAPRGVLANVCRQSTTNRLYVHLVNLTEQPVGGIDVRVRLNAKQSSCNVELLSPDQQDKQAVKWSIASDTLNIHVPTLDVYGVLVIA
ncbi:MAG: hypothetical protein IT440_14720, partial [Phycisphaeraceae bacterium]|nr:hypothetical protein [Phycisphaeraceae bacterium]